MLSIRGYDVEYSVEASNKKGIYNLAIVDENKKSTMIFSNENKSKNVIYSKSASSVKKEIVDKIISLV